MCSSIILLRKEHARCSLPVYFYDSKMAYTKICLKAIFCVANYITCLYRVQIFTHSISNYKYTVWRKNKNLYNTMDALNETMHGILCPYKMSYKYDHNVYLLKLYCTVVTMRRLYKNI